MWRVDSLEKTLMLGGIGGRRRRGRQRMRWLDGITDLMDVESEWTPRVDDGQGVLACCDSWGCKESDTTEPLNWTETWVSNNNNNNKNNNNNNNNKKVKFKNQGLIQLKFIQEDRLEYIWYSNSCKGSTSKSLIDKQSWRLVIKTYADLPHLKFQEASSLWSSKARDQRKAT